MGLRHKSASKLLGRVLSGIALCSLLAFSLLPIPLLLPEPDDRFGYGLQKDLSVPFACMHRRCGCKSAAQCSKQCCCFNASQKAEWEKQHSVTSNTKRRNSKSANSLQLELCSVPEASLLQAAEKDASEPANHRAMQLDWVNGPQFSVCHGQSSLWLCVPVALVPTCTQLSDGSALPADARPIFSDSLDSAEALVPTPPPKLV